MKKVLLISLLIFTACSKNHAPPGLAIQFRNDGLGPLNINWFLPQNLATSPTSLNFGQVAVGKSSPPLMISLVSDTEVQLTGVVLGGTNSADFSVASGCPIDILPTKGCNIAVVFTPHAVGTRTATLALSFIGAPNAPTNVNVTVFAGRKQEKKEDLS